MITEALHRAALRVAAHPSTASNDVGERFLAGERMTRQYHQQGDSADAPELHRHVEAASQPRRYGGCNFLRCAGVGQNWIT